MLNRKARNFLYIFSLTTFADYHQFVNICRYIMDVHVHNIFVLVSINTYIDTYVHMCTGISTAISRRYFVKRRLTLRNKEISMRNIYTRL